MWRRGQVLTTLGNSKVKRIVGVAAAPSIVGFAAAPSEWIDMEAAAALGS